MYFSLLGPTNMLFTKKNQIISKKPVFLTWPPQLIMKDEIDLLNRSGRARNRLESTIVSHPNCDASSSYQAPVVSISLSQEWSRHLTRGRPLGQKWEITTCTATEPSVLEELWPTGKNWPELWKHPVGASCSTRSVIYKKQANFSTSLDSYILGKLASLVS